ncbi:MAG TPA: ribosome maturation factor RimM [Acholeplasmatales bacterium]|nr:ribosome maturation factor RimM [Acholeplasmatales bacterium]
MKYIEIGKIIGTHGIKGEVKIFPDTDFRSERFQKNNRLYLKFQDRMMPIVIDSSREFKNVQLVAFNKIKDINEVQKYLGCPVYVDRDSLGELPENEFYYDDLIGMNAVTVQGEPIGIVVDLVDVPQGVIMTIRKADGKTAMVPFVDEFVKAVRFEEKIIVIAPIEGLL